MFQITMSKNLIHRYWNLTPLTLVVLIKTRNSNIRFGFSIYSQLTESEKEKLYDNISKTFILDYDFSDLLHL